LDGGRCIRAQIDKDKTARATWAHVPKIALKASTPYRLSVRVLVAEATEESKVYVIAYENGVEAPSHWHHTPFLRGTQDWTTYSVAFRTGPDTTWLKLQCKLWYGTGYAWFDDIVIDELPPGTDVDALPGQLPPPKDDGSPLQLMWYPAQRRPDATLYLLNGSFNPVAFFPWGARAAIKDPHLILETPMGMRVAGPVVCGRSPMPPDVSVEPTAIQRAGRKRLRWRLPIPVEPLRKNVRPNGPLWTGYHFVYVEPLTDCPRTFEWRWQTECDGKAGPEHCIAGRLVGRKGGAREPVADFPLYAQHSGALRHPTSDGRARVLDYLAYAGIRGGLSLTHYQPEYASIDAELGAAGFKTWVWRFESYELGGIEGRHCVYADAKETRKKLCPSAQVNRFQPWWEARVAYYRKRLSSGSKTLIIDYEPPTRKVCFCATCRRAFAESVGLDPTKVATMTPKEIQGLPDYAWGRFRARQNGTIVKHHIAAIHSVDPGVKVGLCSSPYNEWIANHGMDIRLFEPDVAFHAPMIYRVGTMYADLVRSTCEGTRAPVLPFLLASDMAVKGVFPLPADVRLNMLATALSGGRGAILWVGIESLDGEYMNALRRSLNEIRQLQKFIVDGERAGDAAVTPFSSRQRTIDVDGRQLVIPDRNSRPAIRSWTWRSPEGTLAAIINYDKESAHGVRIQGAANARPLLGPKPARTGADAVVEVGPYQVVAIVW